MLMTRPGGLAFRGYLALPLRRVGQGLARTGTKRHRADSYLIGPRTQISLKVVQQVPMNARGKPQLGVFHNLTYRIAGRL